jgi:hypothetical protein
MFALLVPWMTIFDVRLLTVVFLGGCAPVRFVDRAPVWVDHDDKPIALPKERALAIDWWGMRDAVFLPIDHALHLDYGFEAVNVNALDEVPESSWFHDPRHTGHGLRPAPIGSREMELGAAAADDMPVPPITITSAKILGATPGFVARDARGVKYLFKLDPPGRPLFATSVEVVVSRLAWACGWRVPAEMMIKLPRAAIGISPTAKSVDGNGKSIPFTHADLSRLLFGRTDNTDQLWVLASRWLPGRSIGPFQYFGQRRDDPNDRFAHENRRDVRGFGVFAAWVNDIDTLENNTLDMYEGSPGRGHIVHYQQDVGGAFGVWSGDSSASPTMRPWMGHASYLEFGHMFGSLFSFGGWRSYWLEDSFVKDYERRAMWSRELGAFDADHFDPRKWKANLPNPAFVRQTKRDRYWAAKRIALIDDRELHAAIEAGRYPPLVARKLFEILAKRRELLLRAYLGDLAALDYFHVENGRLCFDDLWLRAGLGGHPRYFAREGGDILRVRANGDGTACADLLPLDDYRVVELKLTDDERHRGTPVRVHLKHSHIIGVER